MDKKPIFRGKEIALLSKESNFVYGDLITNGIEIKEGMETFWKISTGVDCEYGDQRLNILVSKSTVCQGFGILDKNGIEIFEKDILKNKDGITYVVKPISYYIRFHEKKYGFEVYKWSESEVIGNTIDSPLPKKPRVMNDIFCPIIFEAD